MARVRTGVKSGRGARGDETSPVATRCLTERRAKCRRQREQRERHESCTQAGPAFLPISPSRCRMTEQELLDAIRREMTDHKRVGAEAQKRTAKRCRECFAENEPASLKCASCGHDLAARAQQGKVVACPESGETETTACFVL